MTYYEQRKSLPGGKACPFGDTIYMRMDMEIRLPWDGTVVGRVPMASEADVDAAVASARTASRELAAMSNAERSDLLFRLHGILRMQLDDIGRTICQETGKPIQEAGIEAARSLETLFAAAIAARELHGEVVPMSASQMAKDRYAMTVREPRGVVACITPFNVPFNLAMHKVAPALGGGNAVVHKPAEQTPLSARFLVDGLEKAGAPRGAYNLVTGDGKSIGPQLVRHPGIDMVTFTGSVAVGRQIRAMAGLKKVTLELGNISAVVVEPDADLSVAIPRTVQGAFSHSGQVCISVQRAYVHETIYDDYVSGVREGAAKLIIGHPYEGATQISSLISVAAAQRVEAWINEAAPGQGRRTNSTVPPTVLTGIEDTARLSCEEVFGPVVAVWSYRELDDAIARVNATPYGLQHGIFTRDIGRAFDAARRIRAGGVLINDVPMFRADHMPYGGVKESGDGREGPRYAMDEMTEMKLVVWR